MTQDRFLIFNIQRHNQTTTKTCTVCIHSYYITKSLVSSAVKQTDHATALIQDVFSYMDGHGAKHY